MRTAKNILPLSGKVAWITGASSGIGEQLSYQFAARGAALILSSRKRVSLEAVRSRAQEFKVEVRILPLDLERLEELPKKAEEALAFFGRIDYMVHNAGVGLRDFALDTDLATDQKIMNTNYFGPMVITKAVVPDMLRRKSGHLVVISSLSGKYGVPRTSSYAASKHAVQGFYETLRSEIAGSGVKITIIVPGIIQTRITAHALDGGGHLFGRVEQTFQSAYPVEKAAGKILQAVLREKEEVFVGGTEGITLIMNRISPWFLRRFIRNHPIKRLRNLKKKLFPGKRQYAET
ncbi:SDR family NAD(P)-dependent oxidoreductase [Flavilitoribacter nigricans]|uniref:Dehydrogenase n=1 Tax=Flavilitoribacter nigricans (strain ATCC 23147 / DSM 23189 / NBRC 102662 / NCIMB 1420 / SS-2) TaxID=1122177 RepID=A0A2D0NC89_FLAN2|nr:SDR family NAD(P)-dependent oxidoreductase [Flavilitoribacter nigricans]PHN06105.1 dehydrogenase [Flavilitoribacter nigricans DSM 23189 = NBRC 102662]